MISHYIHSFLQDKKYPKFDLKAVFFDMDGVLYNSMPYHAEAWVKTMQELKLPFTEYDVYMNEGRTGESTINAFFPKVYNRKATDEEVQNIYKVKSQYFNQLPEAEPIENVFDFLKLVKNKGLEIFLVTGSGQLSLLEKLNRSFPNIFQKEKMVTAFDVKYGKPHPEPYLMALSKGNFDPWQAIVVENAPLGVRSAIDAGIFTIAVNTGILQDEELTKEGANVVFPTMKSLIESWDL
ncbi:MAG: HAD-IA family hydrolase [Paludibacteraceae bacterium]|nr:HAD-IA family hydrolase [Paludibacteraceae bacterium]